LLQPFVGPLDDYPINRRTAMGMAREASCRRRGGIPALRHFEPSGP
jgi:hypothetical protein